MPIAAQTPPKTSILLLAAGRAKRMRGRDKLLEKIDGIPLLRRSAKACLDSHADEVLVILPADAPARVGALSGLDVTSIETGAWEGGMAGSLGAGLARITPDTGAVIVALADMPDITGADHDALIRQYSPDSGKTIVRACASDGRPGQPVLFGRCHFSALAAIKGDRGGRDILRANPAAVAYLRLEGERALTDLDTPEDWARYRARSK